MNLIDRKEYNVLEIIDNKNFISMKKKDVEVVNKDMTDELLKQSMEIIQSFAEKYLTEGSEPQLDIASKGIIEKMNNIYGPTWICFIGEAFAYNIKSQKETFLHCYMGDYSILLYKY